MINNGNSYMVFNDFAELPQIPYRIVESLITDNSQDAEDFWKLLRYVDVDALEKPNLTYDEKLSMIWRGESLEQNYSVFFKPLVGSSLDDSEAQTQMRLFRYTTQPIEQFQAIICFEAEFITNEKTALVYKDGILCERTDLLEVLYLNLMNGRDITVGSGIFTFNRKFSRSCNSQLNISNSKSFYGRSIVLAILFANGESGGLCG